MCANFEPIKSNKNWVKDQFDCELPHASLSDEILVITRFSRRKLSSNIAFVVFKVKS